ncbi:MAG: YbaK/EbsC family protein [Aristaeellaceae bacterium]
MPVKTEVAERLRALGIPFAWYEHAPARTMEDCLALPYAGPEVTFCKNILLCNRQQTAFYLYVTLPDKPLRTSEVSHALMSSRLSFAPEECLERLLRLKSGSLSPLGLWFDGAGQVRLALDHSVRREGKIAFHPCDNTATCVFEQAVFWEQVVPALGHEPIWL